MKTTIKLILAGMIGGMITLGSYKLFEPEQASQQNYPRENIPARYSNYSVNNAHKVAEAALDFTYAAEKTVDAVVHIRSVSSRTTGGPQQIPAPFRFFFDEEDLGRGYQPQPQVGSGSGVIISKDGYIVTNNHVIDNADEIEVTLHDNRSFAAKVVGTDPSTDIAVIKIDEENLPSLTYGSSDALKLGEWVLAVGNPFNLSSTVTAGIVSSKARNIRIIRDNAAIESFIQTDAAVNPGNSGGALVNLRGELVGINTAISSPTGSYTGYAFAVPVTIVQKVVSDLKTYGKVQRAYLGVYIRDMSSKLAEELKTTITEGVYVDSLVVEGAGDLAGIQKKDIIMNVDGKPVKSVAELQEAIGRKKPGDVVKILLNRNGSSKTLSVELKNREGSKDLVKAHKNSTLQELGAEFETLSKQEKKELNLESGVRLKKLYPGKLRSKTQMKEGLIITKINNKLINSVEDLIEELEDTKGGVLIEGMYPGKDGVEYFGFGM
ncbi:Do family serine endopeptidase [Rapidithrix thailandica]|uniref:Do family serine endopeptidase n=1 Tax=Rapidithrix thailandica TaxID=413964 RepID=A0AAW9SIX7_9BACT